MAETDRQDYYRLILVDDEDEVRGRISSKISEESGFCVVGTAGNGHDALELIDECSPHVVITDIRMPFIDGLELAAIIKREYPTIRVAFITGYDEFDYAREAVELGVRSYLTKPLTRGDISRFLDSLKKELDEEFRQNTDLEQMKARYKEGLPVVIDSYFAAFLSNPDNPEGQDTRPLQELGITLRETGKLILVDVERDENDPDIFRRENRKTLVRNSLRDVFRRRHISYHHFVYQDRIVFLVNSGLQGFSTVLDEALLEAVQTSRMYHNTGIDIGVSGDFRGFPELRGAYLEAWRALDNSRFLNRGRIAYITDLEKNPVPSLTISEEGAGNLEHALRFGTDQDLERVIEAEREQLIARAGPNADFRLYLINLAGIAINFASSTGGDIVGVNRGDVLETLNTLSNVEQMFDWFAGIAARLREENVRSSMSNSQLSLETAISYLKANYQDPKLSLEATCHHVGISVSYLSLLFKKNTGLTFVKYLTALRMDKARELLKYSGDRIIEIAEKCGYRDVYYFSHSFKKHEGLSPKQYREKQSAD